MYCDCYVLSLQLKDEGTSFILSNTYHLLLQPGPDAVEKLGEDNE
jgi:queuine/archaeosine tRNA-ribosyltransferase